MALQLGFQGQRPRYVHCLHVAAQVGYLFWRHQAVFGLHFSQCHPQLAPQAAFVRFAPQAAHAWRTVAPGEGG
jgi:hypothetical protein